MNTNDSANKNYTKQSMATNQMTQVTVSVVMCTYNGEKYLKEQIDSILNQTYPIYELIVQDDRSTDRTVDIVKAYQQQDKRVKLYINDISAGFNYNFSSAFTKATGEYIASSDQDDIWRPDKIEVLVAHIDNSALLFHNSLLFTTSITQTSGRKNPDNVLYNELYLLMKPYVPGHECFFRRHILPLFTQAVEQEKNISYDSLLMLAAVTSGQIIFVNEGLVYWRRHPQATSYNTSGKYNLPKGLFTAIKSLGDPSKRDVTRRYFQAVSSFPFSDRQTVRVVDNMKKGTFAGILKACRICHSQRKQLYPYANFLQSSIKSFFTPLYFIRDCSKFVIH